MANNAFLDFISIRPKRSFGTLTTDEAKFSFVDKSSLTFPVLSAVGAIISQVLDTTLQLRATNMIPELVIAGVFGLILIVADMTYNPDSNNSPGKKFLTVAFGILNAFVLAAAFLGIKAVTG